MKIDPQLQKDCYQLAETKEICILLNRNAAVPWFILVPISNSTEYRELFDLPNEKRNYMALLADLLSKYLIEEFAVHKINTGAIGNLVPQLHLHVIGRYTNDACWPLPVWGNLKLVEAYEDSQLTKITSDILSLIDSISVNTEASNGSK